MAKHYDKKGILIPNVVDSLVGTVESSLLGLTQIKRRNTLPKAGLLSLIKGDPLTDSIGVSAGPDLLWSTSGPVADGNGGLTEDVPVHSEGLWLGPAYTRNVGEPTPDGYPEIPEGTTSASCAGSVSGNGGSIEMSATKEVEGRKMLEAFRGEPDGVELKANILSGVVGPNTTLDGDTITVVSGLGSASSVHDTDGSNAGDRYLFDYTIESIDGSAAIWAGVYGEVRTTPGRYVESITAESANTLLGVFARTNGTDFVIKLNSVQKLNPATMTAAALVTMGVGSDELGGFTRLINPGSPNFLYVQDDHFVAVSYDGTSYALIGGTEWDRGEQHLKLVQTNTDGSQFRVGNQRIDIDSEIQWSSWTTFDGSFDPTEYLRFALNNTVPLWLKGWALYKRSLSDTEIAKVLKEFQK